MLVLSPEGEVPWEAQAFQHIQETLVKSFLCPW